MSCTVPVSSVDLYAKDLSHQLTRQLTSCAWRGVQGVSNFPAYGVMQVYYKCKELGYVYEGTLVLW